MPAITRLGLYGGPAIPYPGFSPAAATAVVTGTAVSGGVLESEIVAGGETIVITVVNDTWVAAGATFDAIRQDIIDGLDSDAAEAGGWNNKVRDAEVVSAVVRTSDTVVTITLSAAADYLISANETITVTVPATAVSGGLAITATPTFDITDESGATKGGWLSPEQVRQLEQLIRDARRPREDDSRKRKKRTERRVNELRQLYDEVNGLIPAEAAQEIAEAVEPYTASYDTAIPPPPAIDWQALLSSMDAVERLSLAILDAADLTAEEDELILLMMA